MAYIRKTIDKWCVLVNYGYGWEIETIEDSKKEAIEQAKCYRNNINYPIRIVKKRFCK